MRIVLLIDIVDEDILITPIEDRLGVEALVIVNKNFDSDSIDEYDKMVSNFIG